MPQLFDFERQITQTPITIKKQNGDPIDVILGLYKVTKTFNGETKITHFVTVGNTEDGTFHDSNVRLYIPLRGAYEPTDEEIIALFQGESIHLTDLPKRDGGTYGGDFIFDMWHERSFTNRFGEKKSPNFTGELSFAPRKSKSKDQKESTQETDHW